MSFFGNVTSKGFGRPGCDVFSRNDFLQHILKIVLTRFGPFFAKIRHAIIDSSAINRLRGGGKKNHGFRCNTDTARPNQCMLRIAQCRDIQSILAQVVFDSDRGCVGVRIHQPKSYSMRRECLIQPLYLRGVTV